MIEIIFLKVMKTIIKYEDRNIRLVTFFSTMVPYRPVTEGKQRGWYARLHILGY